MSSAVTVILCAFEGTVGPPGSMSANFNAALASFAQHDHRQGLIVACAFKVFPGRAVAVAIPSTSAADLP